MRCLVTGAAGFIGSHLCEALLSQEHEVVGIDAFIPYYPRAIKERNLIPARRHARFRFAELDLRRDKLAKELDGVEVVYHIGAMAGLLKSWSDFDEYWTCNVQATQRLLDAVRQACPHLQRFIYASTSSVYGRFASGDESLPTRPISPYGVTKLAGEQLCQAFRDAFGLPVVILRYFSVYGPRQRPEMGYYKFIEALLRDQPITVCGDGQQVRGNTFVSDCVAATIKAADARPGDVFNVGGGESASVWDVIRLLEEISQRKARTIQSPARTGDQRHTLADTAKIRDVLAWEPRVSLREGLRRQWDWQQAEISDLAQ